MTSKGVVFCRVLGAVAMVTVWTAAAAAQTRPTRVILFVADGAGAGHWGAALTGREQLAVHQFPVAGLIDTRGADHTVTESAASATAYATGVRSFPSALGVGPDSQPRTTALEIAQQRDMATGLITTTFVIDATPAAFAVHGLRTDFRNTARQMAAKNVTVILGGGRLVFEAVAGADSLPLLFDLEKRYTYVDTVTQFRALQPERIERLLGLFAERDMPLAPRREPSLAAMTKTALAVLDRNPRGFFLLVENEETDSRAHNNDSLHVLVSEMLAFDDAVLEGLAYQARNPETLIVVLGDHETGGFSVTTDSTGALIAGYHTGGHTAEPVPVFARGPGAEHFTGLLENQHVGVLLQAAVQGEFLPRRR